MNEGEYPLGSLFMEHLKIEFLCCHIWFSCSSSSDLSWSESEAIEDILSIVSPLDRSKIIFRCCCCVVVAYYSIISKSSRCGCY